MMLRFPNKAYACMLIVSPLQNLASDYSKLACAESLIEAGLWQALARPLTMPAITFAPTN